MVDSRIENLAKLCVEYNVDVKPKEKVFIQGNVLASPLIKELCRECLLSGARPTLGPSVDVEYLFLKYAKEDQLKFVPPLLKFLSKETNVAIRIPCEPSPKRLTHINQEKICEFLNQVSKIEPFALLFGRWECEQKIIVIGGTNGKNRRCRNLQEYSRSEIKRAGEDCRTIYWAWSYVWLPNNSFRG